MLSTLSSFPIYRKKKVLIDFLTTNHRKSAFIKNIIVIYFFNNTLLCKKLQSFSLFDSSCVYTTHLLHVSRHLVDLSAVTNGCGPAVTSMCISIFHVWYKRRHNEYVYASRASIYILTMFIEHTKKNKYIYYILNWFYEAVNHQKSVRV